MKKNECKVIVKHAVEYLKEKFHLEGWDFEYKVQLLDGENGDFATNNIDSHVYKSVICLNHKHEEHKTAYDVFRTMIHEFVHIIKDKEDSDIAIAKESYFADNDAMIKVLYNDKEEFIERIARVLVEAWFDDFELKCLVERNETGG